MTAATPTPRSKARLLHTMLRVGDLDRALAFYVDKLGMRLSRKETYPTGKFTLAFVGYGDEQSSAVIELTHNWDQKTYERGTGYGHIALEVADAAAECARLEKAGVKIVRPAGPMSHAAPERTSREVIAFIEDPEGYRIELIEPSR